MTHGEITLYHGLARTTEIMREGTVFDNSEIESQKERYVICLDAIINAINFGYGHWNHVQLGYPTLVHEYRDAEELIDSVEESYEGSHGLIVPFDFMHGKINFFRKIIFPNADTKDKSKIIKAMLETGYIPSLDEHTKERLGIEMRAYELTKKKGRKAVWEAALKFK